MKALCPLPLALFISALSHGAQTTAEPVQEEMHVLGLRQSLSQAGRLQDVIQKTEVLDADMIDSKNALSLTDALKDEPGVRVSNECSMCGVKRVMMNGMRGEHTTILVDGLPTHTLISGFYAVDAIATTGVERIEIARGAGASLIAPEAIGGTVNIVTKEALSNAAEVDFAKGSHDFTALKVSATGISDDAKSGITLIGQYDKQDQEDHDDNGVSEAPFQENQSLTARINHDLNAHNNIQLRLSKVASEIFGGPVIGTITNSIGAAIAAYDGEESAQLFTNDDVREQYIGKAWETTEWIKTSRNEGYLKWLTELSSTWTAEFAFSSAEHIQDSFYEGIDYYAEDKMKYGRAKFDWVMSEAHFLTFGLDTRMEEMRSKTQALEGLANYVSDSFDYTTTGIFIQDTWTPAAKFEASIALRLDHVEADFVDPDKPGTEISETIFAPRFDLRYFHSDSLTSRLSAGRGYRAPLSFFESDHGILDAELGFAIEVDELERSNSVTYALSYDNDELTATLSAAHSKVENLASLEETEEGVPVLSQLDEDASVSTVDLVMGYKFTQQFSVNMSLENFNYDENFQSSYAVAPVEERAGLELQWKGEKLDINFSTTWYGSRDLNDYGYEGYNVRDDASTRKTTKADSFFIANIKTKYSITPAMAVYAGVSNLFEYTQIEEGDTPLFYDSTGSYDVAYIYGPLHGREFYAGVEFKF